LSKLKDFAQKCTRCLETHICVRVHFVRWSKSDLKTDIKLKTNTSRWSPTCYHKLVLIKERKVPEKPRRQAFHS